MGVVLPFVRKLGQLKLTVAEMRQIRWDNPSTCEICGDVVFPLNGMWWNPDARLHNYTCKGYPEPQSIRVPPNKLRVVR